MFVEGGTDPEGPVEPAAGGSAAARAGADELDSLAWQIAELGAEINAATCRWLGLIADFDARGGPEAQGFHSCTAWLAWRCGLTPRSAREQVRVARALQGLPAIRGAFERGGLSYSKVRALTRVAELEFEEELLGVAEHATAAQLERLLRAYGRAISPSEEEAIQDRRHLRTEWQEDGSLRVRGVLPPEEGGLLLKALELAQGEIREEARGGSADEPPPTPADALMAVAEGSVARGVAAASGGDRQQVVVHVDLDALTGRVASHPECPAPGPASIDGVAPLSPATAKRLACDASIVSLVERDGEPLSVGRKTRSIPPALARALHARDRGCRFPGCERTRFVDAHHIEHWANGGETRLDNLVQLCRHHHRLVHEGGYSVERDGRELAFRTPGGRAIDDAPGAPPASGRGLGLLGAPPRVVPEPGYEPLDLEHATVVLAAGRARMGR